MNRTATQDRRERDKLRRAVARSQTEAEFQAAVIDLARLRGWLVMHTRPARTAKGWATPIQGDKGYPDLTLARHKRVVFLELKSQKGRVSADQKHWLEELPDANLFRPSDWDEIERLLR